MIKTAFVRGKFLNNFEGQNYRLDRKKVHLTAISSRKPIHTKFSFKQVNLRSISDIDFSPWMTKVVMNRILGDSQILFGLENLRNDFDIFHSGDPHYYYTFQLAKLRKRGLIKGLISTSWETIPFNNEGITRKKYIKDFSKKYIDLFICYTNRAKRALISEGISESKIRVVTLGVDLKKFRPARNERQNSAKSITILYVGRLVEEKGILDLYRGYKKWRAQNKIVKLNIIGEGPLKNELRNQIKADGFENSVSIERKSYEQMPKLYQSADIFILPSKKTKEWEEQYGMVLIEALASGLPVIAYDSGSIRENLEDAGILVKEGDIQGLVKILNQLLKNSAARKKLGRMGRKRAEKFFDSEKTARKIERIYAQMKSI